MASIDLEAVRRHPVTRALNPVTTGRAAQSNPGVTVVSLAGALVLLNVWKAQVPPDLRDVSKDVLLVLGLVALASVAPRPVIGVLWVALLLWVLRNGADVAGLVQQLTRSIPIGRQ